MIEILENRFIKMSFDSKINNVVELVNKATGDNYIKSVPKTPVLSLWCLNAEKNGKVKFVPSGASKVVSSASSKSLKLQVDSFTGNGTELDIKAEVTVEIGKDCMLKWSVSLKNNDSAHDIVEVLFPHIRGVFLGESFKDDTIIYPHHAGEKTLNPVKEYTSERFRNFTRANTLLEDGIYVREINYCGLASMMWMYYYDKHNGFYISSNDSNFLVTGMRVETGGPEDPWMGFGIRKHLRIKAGTVWDSEPYTVAVNCDDWHWGAKTYRKWIEPYISVDNNPSFLKDEFVLNQCYDFKKDGKILNRFENIPQKYDAGLKYHMKHMFIASWNRKGFDCNYAEYYPDMDLGTSMDLYDGCQYVNQNGGFVTFYINSRLFDTFSDFYPTLGSKIAIKKVNGDIYDERYDGESVFAVMCPSDEKWQKLLTDTACWMVKSYGATGIYLDQLGSAEPFACYDSSHSHKDIGEFNRGYLHLIKELKEKLHALNPNAFLMIENCGDIYGSYIWGNLTWNGEPYDEFFNVYKYTFPEYVQVNMVNPNKDVGREESASLLYSKIERALLLGSVLWIGLCKFNPDNEELRQYAEKAVNFRQKINPFIKNGVYSDDEGITFKSTGINVSRWKLNDGGDLFMIGNMDRRTDCRLLINSTGKPGQIESEDMDGKCFDIRYDYHEGNLEICLPASRMLYLHISRG